MAKLYAIRLLLCGFLLIPFLVNGQEFSKYAIVGGYGLGTGIYDGWGSRIAIGYQKDLHTGRARVAPQLSLGCYTTAGIDDARVIDYTTIRIQYDAQMDLIKINSFSIVLGTGLSFLRSAGIKDAYELAGILSSESFSHNLLGANLQLGFRLAPKNRRTSYEMFLLDGTAGRKYREASTLNFRICVRLNEKR